jgi:Ca2+-binding RTX toxin-like protein
MPGADGSDTLPGGAGDDILSTLGPDEWGVVVVEISPQAPVDPVTAQAELDANPGPVANAILPTYDAAGNEVLPTSAPAQAASAPFEGTFDVVIPVQTTTPTANNAHIVVTQGQTDISGGQGDDTLQGNTFDDVMRGGDGNDSVQGGSAFDDINGNKGADTIDGGSGGSDWLVGGQGDDLITSHHSGNILYGNLGNDTLVSGDGVDVVRGGQGDDSIVGGAGNDFISGDRGNDTESGGPGADIFHGSQDAGIDKVLDFHQAEGDRVQLDPGTTYTLAQVGADTVIDMGNGNQMILVGVQLSALKDGWIFEG